MSKKITIVSNATTCKILDANMETRELATELLSYFVAGYDQTPSFKAGRWDGKSTMYNWETNTFPVGFKGVLCAELVGKGYQVQSITKPLPMPLGRLPETLGGFSYTDRYDYQWKLVNELEKRGIMIARYATGAGKTFAAALAYARIGRPTLILTKRQPLMYQFHSRMKGFGFNGGLVGDNRFRLVDDLTIAMSQTLSKKLILSANPTDEELEINQAVKDYLKKVEFIVGEEAHEVSDASYYSIVQNCPNAYYRLALTATPFMRDKSESNMRLLAAFGGIGANVTEKTLIERGINARPVIKFAKYPAPSYLRYGSNYQKAVFNGISHADTRNLAIVDHVEKAVARKMPTVILIQRQEHGKLLLDMLKRKKIKVDFIFGESKNGAREKALEALGKGQLEVLIGSTIIDVGIDVPAISLVVNAGGGKAETAYRQRIGRGSRAKATGENVFFFLDFDDGHNQHLYNHYRERLKVIKGTAGFAENLLPDGLDFPWGLFE